MSNRSYSLRSSAERRQIPTTRHDERYVDRSSPVREVTSESTVNTRRATSARIDTPPVQRTLNMAQAEIEEEDDDDVEEVDAVDSSGHDSDDDQEDHQVEYISSHIKSPFAHLRRRTVPAHSGLVGRLIYSRRGQRVIAFLRRMWHFVLRNAFMTFNLLWLLVPLGCLLIAILVPHHLTTAIRYVDVLSSSQASAYEKGMLRSIVQEIVDVKLSSLQEEMAVLRNTIVSQEQEVDGLRLLVESLRQVHEDTLQKMSVVDTNSVLSIHIEHVVSKHAETLWKKIAERTIQVDEIAQKALQHQVQLQHQLTQQQEELVLLQRQVISNQTSSTNTKSSAELNKTIQRTLNEWKQEVQHNLHVTLERDVMDMEHRMHKVLLAEKEVLEKSAERLSSLDTTASKNPALASMIVSAVANANAKRVGTAPDFAALANGGMVVRSPIDFLHDKDWFTPMNIMKKLLSHRWLMPKAESSRFTSPSLRSSLFDIESWWSDSWWLSRSNARPETALSETMEMGSCWSIQGPSGRLSVKFANRIIANSVTIDHIPEHIAADFSSAPHNFQIFGIIAQSPDHVDFLPFGNFSYTRQVTSQQTFQLTSALSPRTPIDGAMIEITSNHGHPNYTCLYRFQVHGTKSL